MYDLFEQEARGSQDMIKKIAMVGFFKAAEENLNEKEISVHKKNLNKFEKGQGFGDAVEYKPIEYNSILYSQAIHQST